VTCRELADFILAYLDDTMDPHVRARFEQHLALCPACVRYLEAYETTIALGHEAFEHDEEPALRAGVPESLVRGILSTIHASPSCS
jgi:anti-sigma factor RsiW